MRYVLVVISIFILSVVKGQEVSIAFDCDTTKQWRIDCAQNADSRIGIHLNKLIAYSIENADTFELNDFRVTGTMTSLNTNNSSIISYVNGKWFLSFVEKMACHKKDVMYFDNLEFYNFNDKAIKISDFTMTEIK